MGAYFTVFIADGMMVSELLRLRPGVGANRVVIGGGSSSVAERQLPKLNVAGSIPVSRSIKSMVYEETPKTLLHSCSNYMRKRLFSS